MSDGPSDDATVPLRTRRTQAERRARSETGLIVAAAEVIAECGFNAATFDRISERAGYSRGLVTLRFGSKDGLFAAMIDFLGDRLDRAYADRLAAARSGREKLLDFVDVFMIGLEEDRLATAYYVLLAGAIANRLPQRRFFLERHEEVKRALAACIREGMMDGTLAPRLDPDVAATALGCFQLGVAVQHELDSALDLNAMRAFARDYTART